MSEQDTIFVMTAAQMKAIINKTLVNAEAGKKSNQTSLNDAARSLGVDGNWGTALTKSSVVAPGVDIAKLAGAQATPEATEADVWVNCCDNDGNITLQVWGSLEEANAAAVEWLKEGFEKEYPEVDFNQDCDALVDAVMGASDYAVMVRQENFSVPLGKQEAPAASAQDNAQRIKSELALMEEGKVDYIECDFLAQVWVGDNAMAVDPEGDTAWEMTVAEALDLTGKSSPEEIDDDDYARDALRHSIHAPEWVKDWSGPFEVEMSIQKLDENSEFNQSTKKVWNAARDAFIHLMEADTTVVELLDELGLDEAANEQVLESVTQEWWDKYSGQFVWSVEVDGTGKITNHVVDEAWSLLEDHLSEMLKAREENDAGSVPSM